MPQIANSNYILNAPDGAPIECVVGFVTDCYKAREGTGNNGKPYYFRDIKIKIGQEIIKATATFPIPDCKNREIVLTGKKGDRGWTGIKTKDHDNRGRSERILWLTPTCSFEFAKDDRPADPPAQGQQRPAQQQNAEQAPRQQARSQKQPAPATIAKSHQMALADIKQAIPLVSQLKNGHRLATKIAMDLAVEYLDRYQQPVNHEDIRSNANSIFIEMNKKQIINLMPTHHDPLALIDEIKGSGQGD